MHALAALVVSGTCLDKGIANVLINVLPPAPIFGLFISVVFVRS
jgi:hypothetical protein